MDNKSKIWKLESVVSRERIEVLSLYTIDYETGEIRFDVEEMEKEFRQKVQELRYKYEGMKGMMSV